MKFGVLQFFSWQKARVALPTVYERALDRVRIMDRTGYDAVWLAEHHFSTYSVCPSVHLMGMHVAGMTENLRIGTGVSLAALYHPTRLAEEVALLDVLSGGRVNWGAGRGFDAKEFEVFGVPRDESYARFREHVDIVLRAWREERLDYDGRFHCLRDVEVLPKPLQKPHPPVWIASSSPEAIAWSARQGHAILMDPHAPHAELGEKYRSYRRGLEEHGHRHAQDTRWRAWWPSAARTRRGRRSRVRAPVGRSGPTPTRKPTRHGAGRRSCTPAIPYSGTWTRSSCTGRRPASSTNSGASRRSCRSSTCSPPR